MLAGALTAIALGIGGATAAEPTAPASDDSEGSYITIQGAVPDDSLEELLEDDGDATPSPDPELPGAETPEGLEDDDIVTEPPQDDGDATPNPDPAVPEGETPEVLEVLVPKRPKMEEAEPPGPDPTPSPSDVPQPTVRPSSPPTPAGEPTGLPPSRGPPTDELIVPDTGLMPLAAPPPLPACLGDPN